MPSQLGSLPLGSAMNICLAKSGHFQDIERALVDRGGGASMPKALAHLALEMNNEQCSCSITEY